MSVGALLAGPGLGETRVGSGEHGPMAPAGGSGEAPWWTIGGEARQLGGEVGWSMYSPCLVWLPWALSAADSATSTLAFVAVRHVSRVAEPRLGAAA